MFDILASTPLQKIDHPLWKGKEVEVYMKRDDLIHPHISGNKWRKLKYNLLKAKQEGVKTILTFGGAYSNHIAATAVACKKYGFQSIGIIRGEELSPEANPTLQKAQNDGMLLQFITRSEYRNRDSQDYRDQLSWQHKTMVIPEGGSNQLALQGLAEISQEINMDFDYMVCPVGSGGTLAGVSLSLKSQQRIIGISVLKGEGYLEKLIRDLLPDNSPSNWELIHDYLFGGYAKYDDTLVEFMNECCQRRGVPLDPVYTGKMMYGVFNLIENNYFPKKSKIICLHTGGLQGIAGFKEKQANGKINFIKAV